MRGGAPRGLRIRPVGCTRGGVARLADSVIGDQKRVVTPRAAVDAGASILVIGRPITQAEDPDAAARAIAGTL